MYKISQKRAESLPNCLAFTNGSDPPMFSMFIFSVVTFTVQSKKLLAQNTTGVRDFV